MLSFGFAQKGIAQTGCSIVQTGCPTAQSPVAPVCATSSAGACVPWTEPTFAYNCDGGSGGYKFEMLFNIPESQSGAGCWLFNGVQRVGTDAGYLRLFQSTGTGNPWFKTPFFMFPSSQINGLIDIYSEPGESFDIKIYFVNNAGALTFSGVTIYVPGTNPTGAVFAYPFNLTAPSAGAYKLHFEFETTLSHISNKNYVDNLKLNASVYGGGCTGDVNFAVEQTGYPCSYGNSATIFNIGTTTVTYTGILRSSTGAILAQGECEFPVVVHSPSISLVKTGTYVDNAPIGTHNAGDQITYVFTVTNTGNVTLTNVSINDPKVNVNGGPIATILPLAVDNSTITATYNITQADIDAGTFTNTATVSGTVIGSPTPLNCSIVTATDKDDQNFTQTPALRIVKTATPSTYSKVGDVISYSYVVTNTGNVTLKTVTVLDDKATVSCPVAAASLAPGSAVTCTATYTITQSDLDLGSVKNTAYAKSGDTQSLPDDETVNAVKSPALSLTKSALPVTYNAVGQTISYTYTIRNSGNVTLDGPFSVADDKATVSVTQPVEGELSPNEECTATATYTITSGRS